MRTRSRLALGLFLITAVGIVTWHGLRFYKPEPVYAGKRLSLWLAQGPSGFDDGADEFLGKNSAIVTDYLISTLRKGDNLFWKPYMWLTAHAPAIISKNMSPWMEPKLVRIGATYWLAQLGARAKPAVPDLSCVGSQDRYPEVRQSALWALGRVDSESKETVALFVTALSNDKDVGVRRVAVGVLEIWAPGDPTVVSALIKGLKDSDALVRQISAAALGKYGNAAAGALGPLKDLAGSNDAAADYAARAWEQIHEISPICVIRSPEARS